MTERAVDPPPGNRTPLELDPSSEHTLAGLAGSLRGGHLTASALLDQCLALLDAWEPRVQAWVQIDRDAARRHARNVDEMGLVRSPDFPLAGLPVGVKDIVDVAGLPTRRGLPDEEPQPARDDASLVQWLRHRGALILGKTVTTAGAWVDPPPTRNPWNQERTPGGSSSGSAAAVAAGMVPLAIGTQTGGSLIRPGSYCGIVALKPGYGVLPTQGIAPLAPRLDHAGFLARSAHDLAWLWNHLLLIDLNGPTPSLAAAPGSLRLGRLGGLYTDQAQPATRTALDRGVARFEEAGFAVQPLEPPAGFDACLEHHRVILAAEAAAVHQASPIELPARLRALVDEGGSLPATRYIAAVDHQQRVFPPLIDGLFSQCDALVMPAVDGPAPGPEQTGSPAFQSPWSYAGLPAITIPLELDKDGMPLGMQLVGSGRSASATARLLDIARACETVLRQARAGTNRLG